MHARVNSSSLAGRGNLESENENLSSKEESVPQEPDFKSLLSQVDKLESSLKTSERRTRSRSAA